VSGFDYARRAPGKHTLRALWWDCAEMFCEIVLRMLYVVRVQGCERVPKSGAVIFLSNHQSYLDPVVNGIATKDRQAGYLARSSLFKFDIFGKIIASVGAIPLKEQSDMAAIRAAIHELQAGRCITIYPEGGRSEDGEVAAFQRGIALIIRRARVPVVPMAVEGPFRVWPHTQKLPRPFGRLLVAVGDSIPAATLLADADDGMARLHKAVCELQRQLRRQSERGHD